MKIYNNICKEECDINCFGLLITYYHSHFAIGSGFSFVVTVFPDYKLLLSSSALNPGGFSMIFFTHQGGRFAQNAKKRHLGI